MSQQVNTCNQALILLGEKIIQSLEEDSTQAKVCATMYPDARKHCLREIKPSFALRRAKLTAVAATPAWGFDYAYRLPQDYEVVVMIDNVTLQDTGGREWRVEGKNFLTNRHEPNIGYVSNDSGEDTEDASFRKTLAAYIAYEIAYALTNSTDKVAAMFELFGLRRDEALATYGQESSTIETTNDQLVVIR